MNINHMEPGEQLFRSTVRIQTDTGVGTGFYSIFREGDISFPIIITNKHVIRGAGVLSIVCHEADDSGNLTGRHITFNEKITDLQILWHPEIDVDLVAINAVQFINKAGAQGKSIMHGFNNPDLVYPENKESELRAIEQVTMVGYPNGLWDSKNDLPIARRGITASPFASNYIGKAEFLVGIACFGGSSGSPVLLFEQGIYADKHNNTVVGSRIMLLGVLYAGPTIKLDGTVEVVPGPTNSQIVSKTNTMMHLGYCIKARKILDFRRMMIP
ncbi:trypsin-like peptidase domain-containing protein [Methylobacterium soli]|uniref:Trypsin-like peptidase domain-containing protein n=1 Tax=Methylobacterium soli TaxID=553447 RepID=A0A6L3SNU4_9HYPH|nr:trypsin-like peptidase domain-containing protein [Methylobacterium soli]KAB1070063.1 trypsin-like peptidase domain-containing protein [Methylobacterium soli]GJE43273.1 hypothetical protein AEGHOMDF_2452 [Methylobacterium soli]